MSTFLVILLTTLLSATISWLITKIIFTQRSAAQLQAAMMQQARLETELTHSREKLLQQKEDMARMGEQLEQQFKILAGNVLEEKAQRFNEQQEQSLKTVLEPLRQHIQTFKQDYEARSTKESEDRISLREQVKHMMDLNKLLTEQANSLTQALRGQVKQQGNWGEMILESILQYAGLQKNINYFLQVRSTTPEGQIIQPDVIVRYPDNRAIVIDSKVSLVHYEQFYQSTDPKEQQLALAQLSRSIKAHIDGLSAKAYHKTKDALDSVIMFVPVEAAYITAMQQDTGLWQYAFNKNVILISPTNLIVAMKLVSDMWQHDSINKEAKQIAEKAGNIYDKLAGFIENFEKVGNQIQRAHDSWQDASKQLYKGKGNLISQAEQMKRFKVSTTKILPAILVENALIEDQTNTPFDDGEIPGVQ